jgi:alkanesulfonate monooxygenase SsuD/methylene tetrahydromethanopterin reductase-like flavin-dependent oxidoreductase (luciferase family)
MRYAIDIPTLGELADPHAIARLALAAETAGWDGLSVWDTLGFAGEPAAPDPFVALAAAASVTTRLRLILSVIALPRRRPQLVAQSAATLDRWSDGRLVLGVGTGGDAASFDAFGEPFEPAGRAALMDEGLVLVDAFLRGETVDHDGPGYAVHGAAVGPRPVQRPRPPIWVGGTKPGALRRAAKWDGWIGIAVADDWTTLSLTPQALRGMVERLDAERAALGRRDAPFEVALFGASDAADLETAHRFADAGATWWLETLHPVSDSMDHMLARIAVGPPR